MRIGIIGTGNIGGTLARHLAAAGHEVAVANSRGPETLRDLERELDGRGRATTVADAVAFGDVVVVSIPFVRTFDLPAEGWAGKVVVDTGNYYPQRDGQFAEFDEGRATSSELVQAHLRGAHVVKAFNAIYAADLRDRAHEGTGGQRYGIPVAGDDAGARRTVMELIDQIGFAPVDAGPLAAGGRTYEPGTPAYGARLSGDDLRAALAG